MGGSWFGSMVWVRAMFQIRDASFVNDLTKTALSPDDDIYISVKLNIAKKISTRSW